MVYEPTTRQETVANTITLHRALPAVVTGGLQVLTIVAIVAIILILYKYILRGDNDTYAKILISGGTTRVELELLRLPLFPSEYTNTMKQGPEGMTIQKERYGCSSLHLAWPDFHLRETQTGDRINLPHQVSLTRVQTIRMKAALRTTPSVHLLVANGRRTVFLTPAPPDARNQELPSCPSYTD